MTSTTVITPYSATAPPSVAPIIKDKLFFFVAYEKLKGANLFDRVPTGADTSGRVVRGVSQDQLDEIAQIARDVYGYDVGRSREISAGQRTRNGPSSWTGTSTKTTALPIPITTMTVSTGPSQTGDDNEFEFSDHYYERGAELKSHTGALFSNWTDKFSTEVRVSNLKLDNRQVSRSGIGTRCLR